MIDSTRFIEQLRERIERNRASDEEVARLSGMTLEEYCDDVTLPDPPTPLCARVNDLPADDRRALPEHVKLRYLRDYGHDPIYVGAADPVARLAQLREPVAGPLLGEDRGSADRDLLSEWFSHEQRRMAGR